LKLFTSGNQEPPEREWHRHLRITQQIDSDSGRFAANPSGFGAP
jgi:hypothetical protein